MMTMFLYISHDSGSEFKHQGNFEPGIRVSAGQNLQFITKII